MLKKRLWTAAILIILVGLAIYVLPVRYFSMAVGIVAMIAAWEWTALCGFKHTLTRGFYMALLLGLFLFLLQWPIATMIQVMSGIAMAWWLWSIVWLINYQRQIKKIHLNVYAFGLIGLFVLLPFWFSVTMLLTLAGANVLLFAISLVALADTSAYFVGKRWGKHKLASHISPQKSWEGLWGAFVIVAFSAPFLARLMQIDFKIGTLSIIVFATLIAAVLGDLFESFVKRLAGVKDSGTLLPGHGGFLDRIDSYTAAIPIFAAGYFLL